jgi:uncharacterized membrane protein YhaH (DUF805 family)
MLHWRDLLDPNGRSGRLEFLLAVAALAAAVGLARFLPARVVGPVAEVLAAILGLWFLFVALPRRAHDVGQPAVYFWFLWVLLGLAAAVLYLALDFAAAPSWLRPDIYWYAVTLGLFLWRGQPDVNRWGPAPGRPAPGAQPA